MSWMIQNGSYPYLEGVPEIGTAFTEAGSVNIWQMPAKSYPECGRFQDVEAFGGFANAVQLHTIRYQGTTAQWNAIAKGAQWCKNTMADRVICSDGEVLL